MLFLVGLSSANKNKQANRHDVYDAVYFLGSETET